MTTESSVRIMKTKDYLMFKKQTGNRVLDNPNLKDLRAKIENNNLLDYHPIIVSHDMEVIDGQHRLEVASEEGLEISYIVIPNMNKLEVTRSINTTGKKWTLQNFLDSYASSNHPKYVFFKELMEKNKALTISKVLFMLTNGKCEASEFREGKLHSERLEKFIAIKNLASDFGMIDKKLSVNSYMLRALTKIIYDCPNVDTARLVNKSLAKRRMLLHLPADHTMVVEILEELYNHGLHNKVQFKAGEVK